MRVIAAFFGPYAPEALTAHASVFSHDFKRFERLTKLATSLIYLPAPHHAQAWPQVQTRLPSRLQSHLMGPVYGHAALITVRATWVPFGLPRGSPWWTERCWG